MFFEKLRIVAYVFRIGRSLRYLIIWNLSAYSFLSTILTEKGIKVDF